MLVGDPMTLGWESSLLWGLGRQLLLMEALEVLGPLHHGQPCTPQAVWPGRGIVSGRPDGVTSVLMHYMSLWSGADLYTWRWTLALCD